MQAESFFTLCALAIGAVGCRTIRRNWRWTIVLDDLPPLPPHTEVIWGFHTKRAALRELEATRRSYQDHLDAGTISIYLRGPMQRRWPAAAARTL